MSIVAKDLVMKLQSLLEEKKAAMESIHSLTLEQKEDIEKNQGENLNSFIDKKQTEIEKIQTIDESFQDAVILLKKELDIEALDDIDTKIYSEFKNIKELTKQILDLAQKIMEIEEQN
ncbi:MAG: flagellar export chaperone FlgN, partial [Lutispora sp.]